MPAVAKAKTVGREVLASTGTDGPVSGSSRRRTRRCMIPDSRGRIVSVGGEEWQDEPANGGGGGVGHKPLSVAKIGRACRGLTGPDANEADGIRTRNLRIDSPVL